MQISPKIYVPNLFFFFLKLVPNQLSNKKIASFFFLSFFAIFPSRNESKEGKKKNHRSRSTQNQKSRSNIERITKNLNPKKKKKSQIQTPIPCSQNLTNLHINPPIYICIYIHRERERKIEFTR